MNDDGSDPRPVAITTYTYDMASGELLSVSRPDPPGPPRRCAHDAGRRVFRVSGPGGEVVEFHDRATRYLVVEPDPETGEPRPTSGPDGPRILHLCREAGL